MMTIEEINKFFDNIIKKLVANLLATDKKFRSYYGAWNIDHAINMIEVDKIFRHKDLLKRSFQLRETLLYRDMCLYMAKKGYGVIVGYAGYVTREIKLKMPIKRFLETAFNPYADNPRIGVFLYKITKEPEKKYRLTKTNAFLEIFSDASDISPESLARDLDRFNKQIDREMGDSADTSMGLHIPPSLLFEKLKENGTIKPYVDGGRMVLITNLPLFKANATHTNAEFKSCFARGIQYFSGAIQNASCRDMWIAMDINENRLRGRYWLHVSDYDDAILKYCTYGKVSKTLIKMTKAFAEAYLRPQGGAVYLSENRGRYINAFDRKIEVFMKYDSDINYNDVDEGNTYKLWVSKVFSLSDEDILEFVNYAPIYCQTCGCEIDYSNNLSKCLCSDCE